MALPEGFAPYVTSARRYLFLNERDRRRMRMDGPALAFRARRLDQPGTPLWPCLPGVAQLLAADVLAVEEVLGAGVDELRGYGLPRATAESLITYLEGIPMPNPTFQRGPYAGRMYFQNAIALLAEAARTASFNSDVYELGDKGTARLELDVSAVAGTLPTLQVQIETRKAYDTGAWAVVDAFPLVITTGTYRKVFEGLDRHVRAVCTIGGSGGPSFTFSLAGEAV